MTALTTVGFDTFPISQMSHSAVYLLAVLMVMGASPAGTGGGVKSTTIVAVFAQTMHTLRGKTNVTFLGRQIPTYRLRIASASFVFYIFILAIGVYLLSIAESSSIFDITFEAASALGTVGLSMGITAGLSLLGKLIIIVLMFIGRIGPLTIGLAIFSKKEEPDNIGWPDDVVIG
jgi:trk system potassium uptake protein TrkH